MSFDFASFAIGKGIGSIVRYKLYQHVRNGKELDTSNASRGGRVNHDQTRNHQ